MDFNRAFPFKCNLCDQTFTKLSTRERHVQTMHQQIKYTCDVCFSQFTRMYALVNHKKQGKCKLDISRNPIVQVTPLGFIPSASTTEKVSDWLNPGQPNQKKPRPEKMSDQPSTSTTIDVRPSTSGTPVKGARKQIKAQAATALPPTAVAWNPRTPFSLHLPMGHQSQQPLGTLPESAQQEKRSRTPLSLPLPDFARRTPTPTYPSTTGEHDDGDQESLFSGSTVAACPPVSTTSTDSLARMAAEVQRQLDTDRYTNSAPSCGPSPGPLQFLHQDLALSEASSSTHEPRTNTPSGLDLSLSSAESTNSSHHTDEEVQHLFTPGRSRQDQGDVTSPNLTEAIMDIRTDLETLTSLNLKVVPRDQIPLLCKIHSQLQSFMAPYLIYHRV